MIAMQMADKDMMNARQFFFVARKLHLSTFSAVYQVLAPIGGEQLGRLVAVVSGRGCARS